MLNKKTVLFFTDKYNTAVAENIKSEMTDRDSISVIITRMELKNHIVNFLFDKLLPEGTELRCRFENLCVKNSARKMQKLNKQKIEYNRRKNVQRRILNALNRYNPDVAAVTTHTLLADCLAAVDKYALGVKVVVISEDFVLDKRLVELGVERYFVDNYDMRNALTENGIPDDKIEIAGLPVAAEFFNMESQEEAIRKLALEKNKPTVLISASIMGDENFIKVAEAIKNEDFDANIIVACGKNRHFINVVRNLGFEAFNDGIDMNTALNACDFAVARPTSMLMGAAIVKGKPILAIFPNGKMESANLDYLSVDRVIKVNDIETLIEEMKTMLDEVGFSTPDGIFSSDVNDEFYLNPESAKKLTEDELEEEKMSAVPVIEEYSAKHIAKKLLEMAGNKD